MVPDATASSAPSRWLGMRAGRVAGIGAITGMPPGAPVARDRRGGRRVVPLV
ncbi:hypothetical protein SGM_4185 [Streptomyces griseoaurantiacus M045]|uniref:Uncharacterized protein n=1 Tax=Streptomyces griseoaurantiacus M045 TaxID=996637 RepID=F3NLT0_9ACTN|nr:hypothetical protein SGM_4185 [Streptomyces griseoaurantiacus M045]